MICGVSHFFLLFRISFLSSFGIDMIWFKHVQGALSCFDSTESNTDSSTAPMRHHTAPALSHLHGTIVLPRHYHTYTALSHFHGPALSHLHGTIALPRHGTITPTRRVRVCLRACVSVSPVCSFIRVIAI